MGSWEIIVALLHSALKLNPMAIYETLQGTIADSYSFEAI